jgi:hypothetical protein
MGSALRGRLATVLLHHVGGRDLRAPGDRQFSDFMLELRGYLKWGVPMIFLALLGGRIAYAM